MTDIYISARRGAGAPAEILYGTVTFKPTLAHSRSTSIVLPAPTTFDLVDGELVATNVQPTPEPVDGQIEWAYEVTFMDRHSKTYSFHVGVPDSTSQVNFTSLPRYFETKPPLFGQGPQGVPGEAATVAVGSVQSGATPNVTNSGTNTDAVLNFVLPKGDKGDKGDGVPTGGSALQILRKNSGNTATEWFSLQPITFTPDPNSIPVRSSAGHVQFNTVWLGAQGIQVNAATRKDYVDALTVGTSLPSTAHNLDNYTTTGVFLQGLNAGAVAGSNYPMAYAGKLTVNTVGTIVWQTYQGYEAQNRFFWRSSYNGSWSEWREGVGSNLVRSGTTNLFAGAGSGASNTGEGPTDPGVNGGYELVGIGVDALNSNQRGWKNTAIGFSAMRDNIDGYFNVAIGNSALERTVGGIGTGAANPNAPGSRNVAIGSNAMRYNLTGRSNVAVGRNAAHSSVSGDYNTAVGTNAFSGVVDEGVGSDKTSSYNTAIGWGTVFLTLSEGNTAVGAHALYQADGGVDEGYNTAVGFYALSATGGGYNVAMGYRAGIGLKAGNTNIAIGKAAIGITTSGRGTQNIAVGTESIGALTTGNNNVGMGYRTLNAVTTGSNNVAIGHGSSTGTSSGRSNITTIGANSSADGDFSISIGSGTVANTTNAIVIGSSATGSGASGVVLGHMGQSSATYAVAIGREATAGHTSSIALGDRTSTSAANQVAMGTRHIALSPVTAPANPVDGGRLYIGTSGGKASLRIKFPSGSEITLATEA